MPKMMKSSGRISNISAENQHSQMFQVLSHPCSNLEKSQQKHEESASWVEKKRETSERTEKDREQEWL